MTAHRTSSHKLDRRSNRYSGRKFKRDIANNTGSVVPDSRLAAAVFAICVDVEPAIKTAALR